MVEIEFSYTWSVADPAVPKLVEEFSRKTGVKVKLRALSWSTAWVELFTMASQGQGSDVSNIGSTWVSTLAKLDVLRPFKPGEIAQMGGAEAFAVPAWESAKLLGDPRIWSIPSLGWIYVILYHKGLLRSAGIDPEKAFTSSDALLETLSRLRASNLEIPWVNPDPIPPYVDFLHAAASWVWAEGGDFITPAGDKVLFDSPQAIAGFVKWFNLFRFSEKDEHNYLNYIEARDLVRAGRVAASLMTVDIANSILNSKLTNIKKEDIGFTNMTNTPWTGGGSYVIWNHVQYHPEREHAAVELVKFLSTKESSQLMLHDGNMLPVRMDALNENYPVGNPLRETVIQAATHGRIYYNVSHWRRVEAQLSLELLAVYEQIKVNPTANVEAVLRAHLEPLARKLNMVLAR